MTTRPDEDHELLCDLTEQELLAKGDALAAAVARKVKIEAEKAEANALFKQRDDTAKAEINQLKDHIQARKEPRIVRCVWRRADRIEKRTGVVRKVLELLRTDTGDLVQTRELTAEDMQESLDLGAN